MEDIKEKLFGKDKLTYEAGALKEKVRQLEKQIARHEKYENKLRLILIANKLDELIPTGPHS